MALSKHKIGELITIVDERNTIGCMSFFGINKEKAFMPTVANTDGLDEKKYKVVRNERFVFSGMQTGRDGCIRISMYTEQKPILVSPAYTTFEVSAKDLILPEYFFMLFLSQEKDRLGWFLSDCSIRSNLDWSVFCEIELDLPPLSIQRKYVAIYNAMLENQRCYERGLDDLKLAIDACLDCMKKEEDLVPLSTLLQDIDARNTDKEVGLVRGINIQKVFMPTAAKLDTADLSKYKVVRPGQFAYSAMQTGRDGCIRIALLEDNNPILVSPAYSVLEVSSDDVLPAFIMIWFSRAESDRRGSFMSDASIRANLDLNRFFETVIPLPPLEKQQNIAAIYSTLVSRMNINERLKQQLKDICPILIRGSIEEASA